MHYYFSSVIEDKKNIYVEYTFIFTTVGGVCRGVTALSGLCQEDAYVESTWLRQISPYHKIEQLIQHNRFILLHNIRSCIFDLKYYLISKY